MSKERIGCAELQDQGNLLTFSIDNPDITLIRRSLEVPVRINSASINVSLDYCREIPNGSFWCAEFLFDGSSPNFVLNNRQIDNKDRIHSIKNLVGETDPINKKPYIVLYDIQQDLGLKEFAQSEMDVLAKNGYNLSSFYTFFENRPGSPASYLNYNGRAIILNIRDHSSDIGDSSSRNRDDIVLSSVQKEKLKHWFCTLDNPQQK